MLRFCTWQRRTARAAHPVHAPQRRAPQASTRLRRADEARGDASDVAVLGWPRLDAVRRPRNLLRPIAETSSHLGRVAGAAECPVYGRSSDRSRSATRWSRDRRRSRARGPPRRPRPGGAAAIAGRSTRTLGARATIGRPRDLRDDRWRWRCRSASRSHHADGATDVLVRMATSQTFGATTAGRTAGRQPYRPRRRRVAISDGAAGAATSDAPPVAPRASWRAARAGRRGRTSTWRAPTVCPRAGDASLVWKQRAQQNVQRGREGRREGMSSVGTVLAVQRFFSLEVKGSFSLDFTHSITARISPAR